MAGKGGESRVCCLAPLQDDDGHHTITARPRADLSGSHVDDSGHLPNQIGKQEARKQGSKLWHHLVLLQ